MVNPVLMNAKHEENLTSGVKLRKKIGTIAVQKLRLLIKLRRAQGVPVPGCVTNTAPATDSVPLWIWVDIGGIIVGIVARLVLMLLFHSYASYFYRSQ